MVRTHRIIVTMFKILVLIVFYTYFVTQRQKLFAKQKGGHLHDELNLEIKIASNIKSHSLRDNLSSEFCRENREEFDRFVVKVK